LQGDAATGAGPGGDADGGAPQPAPPRGAGGAGGPLAEGLGAQEPEEALPLIQSRAATGPAAAIHNGGSHSAAASIANTAARPRNTTEGKGPRPRPSRAASPAPFPPVFRP